ncbi:hypothetical protein O181_127532 [Austropuccinia psidii MF-1]|uniref:Uncharacterized protein n=1 Tax=Austropuccinia psidii MF-1 TaxID=1389203 RepID=A0A9Q3KVI0_9BASI|nr:hypothetical protein [Austropuccinia psidii MF-1]
MPSTRSGASYNPSRSSQKGYRHDYGRANQLQKNKEGIQQCIAAQRVPNPCRSVEKLLEFLPDCEKIPWPSQNLQFTQWMAFIDGKEINDAFNSRMEENNPPPPKHVPRTDPVASSSNSNVKRSHKLRTKAKATHQLQNLTDRATESQIFIRIPWRMYFRWPEL